MRKLLLSLMTGAALTLAMPALADAGHDHNHKEAGQEGAQAVSESPLAVLEKGRTVISNAVESGQLESIHEATEGISGAIATLKSTYAEDAAVSGTLGQLGNVVHALHVAGDAKDTEKIQSELKKLDGGLKLLKVRLPESEKTQSQDSGWLKPADAKYVCMVNNKVFDKVQIAVEVSGKTYYGCCPMCKNMLEKDASKRTAADPVSGNPVDKASAVIGAAPDGMVYYFESEENMHKFASGPMPEMRGHMDDAEGMKMQGNEGSTHRQE